MFIIKYNKLKIILPKLGKSANIVLNLPNFKIGSFLFSRQNFTMQQA